MSTKELNEMIDWCRKKISNLPYSYSGKRKEGYEDAMLQVMSYLHSKKCDPVDDTMDGSLKEVLVNKMCVEESDHEWECCSISTMGTTYVCKKCHAYKTYPCKFNGEISITI